MRLILRDWATFQGEAKGRRHEAAESASAEEVVPQVPVRLGEGL
jgi:hypothetical protein